MKRARLYTLLSAFAAALLLALAVASVVFAINDVKAERRGCERLDAVRSTVYVILTTAAAAQDDDANLADTPAQRQAQMAAAHQFRDEARKLIASITPRAAYRPTDDKAPKDGLPDQIHVDCSVAYEYPFGL